MIVKLQTLQSFVSTSNIRKAETERGSLASRIGIKKEQMRCVREEREAISRDKARVFDHLEWANKEVRAKNDLVQKLRVGVSFSRREEIEDQVKRLELQLARSNLKLPDERRLVTEIDRLKRSKRTLQEFDKERQELDLLRQEQQGAREQRDAWFKQSREAKAQEDQYRQDMKTLVDKVEECRRAVTELRQDQRKVEDELEAAEFLYRRHLADRRAEQRRRTELERAAAAREAAADLAEIRATCEPLLAERQLCSALILYCQNLAGSSHASTPVSPHPPPLVAPGPDQNGGATNGSAAVTNTPCFLALPLSAAARRRSSGFSAYSGASSCYATPLGCSPATTPLSGSPPVSLDQDAPGFYKKKKEEDTGEIFFAGSGKKTKKRNRNERRLSFKKGLHHNPETFKQFASLGLDPPSSLAGVEEVVARLREKLSSLEMRAAETKLARLQTAETGEGDKDKDKDIPDVTLVDGDVNAAAEVAVVVSEEIEVKTTTAPPCVDRTQLTLDIKCLSIPEIRLDTSHDADQSEASIGVLLTNERPVLDHDADTLDNKLDTAHYSDTPDNNDAHGDSVPILLVTNEEDEESSAVCDTFDSIDTLEKNAPSNAITNMNLVPTTTSTSTDASLSPSTGCNLLQNLIIN